MEPLKDGDPRELGGYRLVARLGEGGMGVVYLGIFDGNGRPDGLLASLTPKFDPYVTGYIKGFDSHGMDFGGDALRLTPWHLIRRAPTAIKTISPRYASDASMRERFRREVAAYEKVFFWRHLGLQAAHLQRDRAFDTADQHQLTIPGMAEKIRLIDPPVSGSPMPIAHGEDPVPWFAMQYIPHPTLADLLEERVVFEERDLFNIFQAANESLQSINHEFVHRDVKPSNLTYSYYRSPLLRSNSNGSVVLDFGIARDESNVPLTTVGNVIGTVAYMSPEQIEAKPLEPFQSDLFSLASTVASLARGGRSPFEARGSMATMLAICTAEPDLTGVPERFAEYIRPCFTKNPSDRPEMDDYLLPPDWLNAEPHEESLFSSREAPNLDQLVQDVSSKRWEKALELCGLD